MSKLIKKKPMGLVDGMALGNSGTISVKLGTPNVSNSSSIGDN